ncbi:MAG: hypothetical protein HFJ43_05630 [Clostridia bacterium]|nr:hypothetical protein [Clostridia bacterium]
MENKTSSNIIATLLRLVPIIGVLVIIITFVLIFNMKNKILENSKEKINNRNEINNQISYRLEI